MKARVYAHGHALKEEGWGFRAKKGTECKICDRRQHLQDNEGHGRCKCGAQSPHLDTNKARREWYQTHRAQYQKKRPPPVIFSQTTT